ncbi:alkaline phosphatase family protein [Paractinoplanes hotanensis]|uniref:Alkaline phosphatase family protein n=1 Tax=Paractinoplanes hotanensis TaxID=2906497 RepID=A0ABT0YBU4_9ACTN|nr:alkaline phosphatase family protein [Actinoplanes hotanensis]MCM4083530.1 alkaline phosphatase family protein [Actinoplanes hotanensis]
MTARCVVVGVDGFTFRHIQPLLGRGLMPNMASLLRGGASARLVSSTPWQTPVGWTTYATGVNPGQHGIYGWWSPDLSSGELRPSSGATVGNARIWEILSGAGLRVGVVNVPMTYPARPLDGFLLAGLDSPFATPEVDSLFAYPRGLREELLAEGLDYRVTPDLSPAVPIAEMAARWAEVERARVGASELLYERFQPDFLQVNLFLTDYIAHRSRPAEASFETAYRTGDELIGRLRRLAGPETTFIIVSDHGSLEIDKFIMIHNVLRDCGLLHFGPWLADEHVPGILGLPASAPQVRSMVEMLRSKGVEYRESAYRDVQAEHAGANIGFSTIDWDRTKAFCTSDYGQVTVNRSRGRAAVTSADEAARVLVQVRAALLALDDGQGPLVSHIIDRDGLYWGHQAPKGPDLTPVLADHRYYFCQVYSFYRHPESRLIAPVADVVDPVATGCVGDHDPYGVLVMAGPDVPAGVRLPDASIVDLAPTILQRYGLDPLPEFDGVALLDFLGGVRPASASASPAEPADASGLAQRLRDLGYRI